MKRSEVAMTSALVVCFALTGALKAQGQVAAPQLETAAMAGDNGALWADGAPRLGAINGAVGAAGSTNAAPLKLAKFAADSSTTEIRIGDALRRDRARVEKFAGGSAPGTVENDVVWCAAAGFDIVEHFPLEMLEDGQPRIVKGSGYALGAVLLPLAVPAGIIGGIVGAVGHGVVWLFD